MERRGSFYKRLLTNKKKEKKELMEKQEEVKRRDLCWEKGRKDAEISAFQEVWKKLNKKTDCHNYRQLQRPTMHETHYLRQREKI